MLRRPRYVHLAAAAAATATATATSSRSTLEAFGWCPRVSVPSLSLSAQVHLYVRMGKSSGDISAS
jgi:hypothetical protein